MVNGNAKMVIINLSAGIVSYACQREQDKAKTKINKQKVEKGEENNYLYRYKGKGQLNAGRRKYSDFKLFYFAEERQNLNKYNEIGK